MNRGSQWSQGAVGTPARASIGPFNLRRLARPYDCEVLVMSVLLNTRQAAERCNLSPRTLEKHRVTGGGPPFIRLGSAVRYRLEDLDSWIAANRRRSTSDDLAVRG